MIASKKARSGFVDASFNNTTQASNNLETSTISLGNFTISEIYFGISVMKAPRIAYLKLRGFGDNFPTNQRVKDPKNKEIIKAMR